jgi:uncharacterized Tic20 family protein
MLMLPMVVSAQVSLSPPTQAGVDFTDLPSFLNWVIYSGGALLISSWLLEKWKWFQNLSDKWKKFINFTLSAMLAAGFYAILIFVPPDTLTAIDPFFKIILGFIVAFGAQQAYHQLTK